MWLLFRSPLCDEDGFGLSHQACGSLYQIFMHGELNAFLLACIATWCWDAVPSHFVIVLQTL